MARAIVLAVAGLLLVGTASASSENHYAHRNAKIIRIVFGPKYGDQAVQVAKCESGLTTRAANGQYLGLFQMGSWARSVYGHGSSAWKQSFSAEAYFIASGRDWSPWSCKPW